MSVTHSGPATIGLYGQKIPLEAFNDPQKLIADRPPWCSARQTEIEAYDMLMSYLQRWVPEVYAQIPQGTLAIIVYTLARLRRSV